MRRLRASSPLPWPCAMSCALRAAAARAGYRSPAALVSRGSPAARSAHPTQRWEGGASAWRACSASQRPGPPQDRRGRARRPARANATRPAPETVAALHERATGSNASDPNARPQLPQHSPAELLKPAPRQAICTRGGWLALIVKANDLPIQPALEIITTMRAPTLRRRPANSAARLTSP